MRPIPHAQRPQRKSPRLQGYDYSNSGTYFVTICTYHRQSLFGFIENEIMNLSEMGTLASNRWMALPNHHPHIEIDAFIIMPNHVHGLLIIQDAPADAAGRIPTLGHVIGAYKSSVTRHIHALKDYVEIEVWQERYHDHIVRDERGYDTIRAYIENNPLVWTQDKFYTV